MAQTDPNRRLFVKKSISPIFKVCVWVYVPYSSTPPTSTSRVSSDHSIDEGSYCPPRGMEQVGHVEGLLEELVSLRSCRQEESTSAHRFFRTWGKREDRCQ